MKYMAGAALAAMAIFACENESLNIGNSLTDESDMLSLSSETFDVYTRTIMADSVLALSSNCYLGRIKDPETGADVTSEFTSQFHLLDNLYISPDEKIIGRHDGKAAADSCDIVLYIDSPFMNNDSLSAMKMQVSELSRPMEEGQRYYSNLDPRKQDMLRTDGLRQGKMFTFKNMTDNDSIRETSTYIDNIRISLNRPYTAVDGTAYNNYGTYILRQYHAHPEYFRNSYTFIHNVCPGFFFEITDGFGFHARVSNIGLRVYYRVQSDTAVIKAQLTLAGTKEVLQTTHVVNDREAISAMANETTHTYLKTPAGLFTEVTIPVDEIMNSVHASDSLVGAKLAFQRLNNLSTDTRLLGTPATLLMLQRDSLYSFFENGHVPDNKTSFYTSFNGGTTTSGTYSANYNYYMFSNISNLVTRLWQMKQQGLKDDPDWVRNHPNWNKMVLVPITYTVNSATGGITNVQHDMSLNSIRLVGGPSNTNESIKISVVYAQFK